MERRTLDGGVEARVHGPDREEDTSAHDDPGVHGHDLKEARREEGEVQVRSMAEERGATTLASISPP